MKTALVGLALLALVSCDLVHMTDPGWTVHALVVRHEMDQLLHDGQCEAASHLLRHEFRGWTHSRYPYQVATQEGFDALYYTLKHEMSDHGCTPPALDEGYL